jgi:hypothetical protein
MEVKQQRMKRIRTALGIVALVIVGISISLAVKFTLKSTEDSSASSALSQSSTSSTNTTAPIKITNNWNYTVWGGVNAFNLVNETTVIM